MGGNSPEFWAGIFAYIFMWGGLGLIVVGFFCLVFGLVLEWVAT